MRSRAHGRSLLGEARASQLCLRHCPTLQFKKPKAALKSIAEATRIAKCLRALFRSAAQARRIFEFTCKEASLCIIFIKCWDSRADADGFSLLRARARTCARASRAHACGPKCSVNYLLMLLYSLKSSFYVLNFRSVCIQSYISQCGRLPY